MPKDELIHVDDPTFEKVRTACRKPRTYVTVSLKSADVRCRIEVKGNSASIDFDLYSLGSNLSEHAQQCFREEHDAYVQRNRRRFTRSPIYSNFGNTSIHFNVLEEDASDWFVRVFDALLDDANFTPIASPFDFLKSIRKPTGDAAQDKGAAPTPRRKTPPRPPVDSPELEDLRQELNRLQRGGRPKTPEALKRVQRILKTYERPSPSTRYVKRTRGTTCQLCGAPGFVMRNGKRYCEVHHLFHLSKTPPAACLAPEYLVVLCGTCHRRMHYADVGEPVREGQAWRVRVDDKEVLFQV